MWNALPLLGLFVVLSPGDAIWKEAAQVMRDLRTVGQGIGLADGIIAATARLYDLPLVTDNVKHFRRVAGLDVRGYVS